MNTYEMQKELQEIMFSGVQYGLKIYTCHKKDDEILLKEFLVNDNLRDEIVKLLNEAIQYKFMKEGIELDVADNISDNRNVLYEIKQNETYRPFDFLEQVKTINDRKKLFERQYNEPDQETLFGLFFYVNLNSKKIWFYQHRYAIQKVQRDRSLIALCTRDNVYAPLPGDVLRIDKKIDMLIMGDSIITNNISLLEQKFGFEDYIRNEARKTLDIISDLDVVSSMEKFISFEAKEKLTNAKKLMKAKKSPVLQMSKEQLVQQIQKHSRYNAIFVINDGQIVVNSQKTANEFIKMLNDSILRSDLTGQEYDTDYKVPLAPIA